MMKYIFSILLIFFSNQALANVKINLIASLENIENISFDFEQNINGKIETGKCIIKYPKKIYCNYELSNQKTLISNGKSLAIKTKTSYFLYPLDRTPLNLILDKNFLIEKIKTSEGRIIDKKFINFKFIENDNEINIFFNKKNYDLIGWQTLDIYQNLSITYLSKIIKNQNLDKNLFILPKKNIPK